MKIKITTVAAKALCTLLLFFQFDGKVCAQNDNGSIDAPGDIAFVAYHDNDDGFSFILLDDCPNGTSIRFTDDEWTGSAFASPTGEGEVLWSNNTGNTLNKGTVINITDADDNGTGINANFGVATEDEGGFTTANIDELFAFTGTRAVPGTFLAFVGDSVGNTLTGTGLTVGVNALFITSEGYYTGSTTCNSTSGDCAAMINNVANWTISGFTFPGAVPTSYTGSLFSSATTWNGTTNNDWATASNWSTGSVPTASSDVTIPNGLTNYPTISSSVTVNSITINSGASLIANAAVTGATTYNRNLGTTNWYLVSSPVSGESILDFRTNNTFASGSVAGRIGLAPYDNTQASGSRWAYQTTSSTGNLNNGQGFSVKLASAGDLTFTGTVNNSNILRGITIGGGNAFNLVGNPFTAFLNTGAGGFLADNSGALTSQTLWVWNQATNSYDTKVTADNFKLAPGQGFFVECGTAGDVTFETADLSHEGTDTFQRNSSKSEIHLMISTSKENSKTKFYFIEGATKGFDNGYDGKMFTGVSNNFTVYSQLINDNKGVNYAIQSLPKSEIDGLVIPTGLNAKANKEIEFSIDTKNIPENIYVYLEDRLNDKFINLSESNYKTTLSKDINSIGQFYIHTTSRKLDVPLSLSIDDVSIYKSAPNTLTIVGLQAKASLKLFSILGKEVMQKEINSNGVSNIDIPSLSAGVYLVEIASEKGKSSKKIILD